MNDKYLDIFPEMFFDVETSESNENNSIKEIIKIINEASDVLAEVIVRFGEVARKLQSSTEISKLDAYYLHLVLSLFTRKIMEQVDAINILYSYGSVTEAQLILRSMFETVVSLKFILKEDATKDDATNREETRFRAAAYFLGHHYQEFHIADKQMQPGGAMDGKLTQEEIQLWNAKKVAFNNLLNRNPIFKRVDDERNKLKKPEKSAWYEVAGVHNFREMMTAIGMDQFYEGLYGPLSMETHARNVAMGMKVKDDGFYPHRIRSPHEGATTFSLACTFAMSALMDLYKYLWTGDGNGEGTGNGNGSNRSDGNVEIEKEKKALREFYADFKEKRNKVKQDLNRIIV